jgi:hypothetical protein
LSFLSRDRHHDYLENGGTLKPCQTIANHESPCTTKLYDRTRTREELSAEEIGGL